MICFDLTKETMNNHIDDILTLVSKNPITNLISGTGTGKSTVLPKLISNNNKITVVNKKNQKYVKEYLYELVREKRNFDFTDILMIDESDMLSLDGTLIILLWKYATERGYKVPHLLLVSSFPVMLFNLDITYYEINSNRKSKIIYLPDITISDLIDKISDDSEGNIIIFTASEINTAKELKELKEYNVITNLENNQNNNQNNNNQDNDQNNNQRRKIFVTDNRGETLYFLDNILVVIDTMKDIKKELTLTGGTRYKEKYITKRQANLRSSRASNAFERVTYRLISKESYDKLEDSEEPEIFRTPIYNIMLELYNAGIDPYQILTVFDNEILNENYNLLIKWGIINVNNKLTEIGNFVKKLPLGLRNSLSLYYNRTLPSIILMSMIDSFLQPYFVLPLKGDISHAEYNLQLLEHHKKYISPFEGKSDVHTYAKIWNIMVDEISIEGPSGVSSEYGIYEWCQDNFIRYENILEVISVSQIICNELGIKMEYKSFDIQNSVTGLGQELSRIYSDRKYTRDNENIVRVTYHQDQHLNKKYKIDTQAVNSIERDKPDIVYGLITSTISSTYGPDFHLISCSLVL